MEVIEEICIEIIDDIYQTKSGNELYELLYKSPCLFRLDDSYNIIIESNVHKLKDYIEILDKIVILFEKYNIEWKGHNISFQIMENNIDKIRSGIMVIKQNCVIVNYIDKEDNITKEIYALGNNKKLI